MVNSARFCCCCCCECGCGARATALARKAVEDIDVVSMARVGLVDMAWFNSFVEVIVIGRAARCSLLMFPGVRSFTDADAFDAVLTPLTALVAGGPVSAFDELFVFARVLIDSSLPNSRSMVIGGKRVVDSTFCALDVSVVAERYRHEAPAGRVGV